MSDKLGLVGRKVGMTRIFQDDGVSVPVTVIDVSGNRVMAVKTVETDGYNAIQVAFGSKKPSRVNKALAGQFSKAGVEAAAKLKEFHIDADKAAEYKPGTVLGADMFTAGQLVDVTGTTIEISKTMSANPRRIGKIEIIFNMPDRDFSEKEKTMIERAAHTCPVHLSLHPDTEQVFTFKWSR